MIPVKNIYYMFSYAFQSLNTIGLNDVEVESFDNVQKLCAEILIKGCNYQIKRGLNKSYEPVVNILPSVKGKINISESIKAQYGYRRKLVCSYDEFTLNNKLNQIIKSTLIVLLKSDILIDQKKEIKSILLLLNDVETIDLFNVDWNMSYNKNNQNYRLLITICYFVVKGLLQTQTDGNTKVMNFFDEQRMSRLYEKFILEYYRKHFPDLSASSSHIKWQLNDQTNVSMLPIMKSDVVLKKGNAYLIIDAKYYTNNTQEQYNKNTIHSANMYQIFTYVKNKEYELSDIKNHSVSGMLLYAKTDSYIQPSLDGTFSGNKIYVQSLDLNDDFLHISSFLNQIPERFL